MARNTIIMRAMVKNDITTVKALIGHPMESGFRINKKTGDLVPIHFIQNVEFRWHDKIVMTAFFSTWVSQNPYVSFKFDGGKAGDIIQLRWTDNKGMTDTATMKIFASFF